MKALSIDPYFAMEILWGIKTVECRTWKTEYRGDLLICSTAKKRNNTIPGHALCIAELADVVSFKKEHLKPANMQRSEVPDDCYAWILKNVRFIYPFAVKGKLSLWNCEHEVKTFEGLHLEEEWDNFIETYYKPLYV